MSTKFKESAKLYTSSPKSPNSNASGIQIPEEDEAPDRELTEEEKDVLEEFAKNDKELEDIALLIANDLDSLKDKAIRTGEALDEQHQLLTKANEMAENTELELNRQNNQLAAALKKFRGCKQLIMDFVLLFILMGFVALLYNRLQAKGYI